MERYSILRTVRGAKLMEMDVLTRFPISLRVFNWIKLYGKIVEKATAIKQKCMRLDNILKSIEESRGDNYRAGLALLLIPYIVNGASKLEILQSFIKEYNSLDELRSDSNPADLQIRFVHSHHQVIHTEFSISGCIFQCSDLMESLESLFYYIIAMNIDYPIICNHVW
ncbi:uncharacterized protein LOC142237997 [Haematobia irritans]|uniref:uncharacterized protein LOC142237997 n=1 Tax=Haematobia irritans TaxID=7368 RepID=UPI003F4FE6B7